MTIQRTAAARLRRTRQGGVTLLEIIISLGILGVVIVGAASLVDNHMERMRSAATAQQMTIFANAVQSYIKDNYSDLTVANTHNVPTATASIPAVITVNTLQTTPVGLPSGPASPTKYLPSNFAPVNAYGQTICALVLQPKANELYAMIVTEGGNAINDLDLGLLAGLTGSAGGGIYSTAPTIAKGTMGKWQFNLANDPVGSFFQGKSPSNCSGTVGSTINLVAGHPLMALWFASDTSSAFLYRDKVPGHPELNQMQTDIRFKDDTTKPDPANPGKTLPVYGASLSLQIIRTVDTECDKTPTGLGTPVLLGTLARDVNGMVLSCQYDAGDKKNYWRPAASLYWGDPVKDFATLEKITCSATQHAWQTRIVEFPTVGHGPRAYTCGLDSLTNSWRWMALAVDDEGILQIGVHTNVKAYKEGQDCYDAKSGQGTGSITKDASGQLLVCTLVLGPNGWPKVVWKGSAAIGRWAFRILDPTYPGGQQIQPFLQGYFVGTGHMTVDGHFSGTLYCDPNKNLLGINSFNPICGSGGTINCADSPVSSINGTYVATQSYCAQYFALHSQVKGNCVINPVTLKPTALCFPAAIDPLGYYKKPLMVDVVDLPVGLYVRQW